MPGIPASGERAGLGSDLYTEQKQKLPVGIVEGEFKALSLCLAGVPAVGIGGVWNWLRNKELLPVLARLAKQREILILFDSDTDDKPLCAGALYHLAKALMDAGATPRILHIPHLPDPESPSKTGADDLVRLKKFKDEKLREYLLSLEDEKQFPVRHELFRFNAEYVLNLKTAKVHQTNATEREWKVSDFCSVIENDVCPSKNKKGEPTRISVAKEWVHWKQRNAVYDCTYEPLPQSVPRDQALYVQKNGHRYLNDWKGWASEPEQDAEGVAKYWTRLLDHLFQQQNHETKQQTEKRQLCRRWFEMWWAYPVQHPGAKLLSCAALLGRQGSGKGLVGSIVGEAVYGPHFQEITQKNLDSKFNALYSKNKSLVMGSEITSREFGEKREVAEYLKHIITGKSLVVEQKFVAAEDQRNLINLYLTSNYGDALTLDGDDRRYFVWNVPPVALRKAMGDVWVDELVAYKESEKGKSALHHHLLHLPIDTRIFDSFGFPPDTEAKQHAKEYSQNEVERWITTFAEDPEDRTGRPGETVWRAEEVYAAFCAGVGSRTYSLKNFLLKFRDTFQTLGRATVKIYKNGKLKKCKTGLWVIKPDYKANTRFTTLAEAKAKWQLQIKNRRSGIPPLK